MEQSSLERRWKVAKGNRKDTKCNILRGRDGGGGQRGQLYLLTKEREKERKREREREREREKERDGEKEGRQAGVRNNEYIGMYGKTY